MEYILKNKDRDVLEFSTIPYHESKIDEWEVEENWTVIKDVNILNEKLLPYSFIREENNNNNLKSWIENRNGLNERAREHLIYSGLSSDLDELNLNSEDFFWYVDLTLALSLNDSYWIIPKDKEYKWEDYNLYENSFDKSLSLSVYEVAGTRITRNKILLTPEITTRGSITKCWQRRNCDGAIELYKSFIQNPMYKMDGVENFCEYYMAQIANILGLNCINYDLKEFYGGVVSTCELFTSENIGYIPIYKCVDEDLLTLSLIDEISKVYGRENLEDLLLFDALILNEYRHLGKFGMLIDNNTNKILSPAPIFDNGDCFFNLIENYSDIKDDQDEEHYVRYNLYDTNDIEKAIMDISRRDISCTSGFGIDFDKQASFAAKPRHIEALSKLLDFTFIRHKKHNLNEAWLKAGERFIQKRSKKIIDGIKERE